MVSQGAVRIATVPDEEQWATLIPKLVEAYIRSCAYKKPNIVMDDSPVVVCGCEATTVKKVTCYYLTRIVARELVFCPCHDGGNVGETLLKKYHLFPATGKYPKTSFHVELLGFFGDTQTILSASFNDFSKLLSTRFYGGKGLPSSFKEVHHWYLKMMNDVEKALAGDDDGWQGSGTVSA
ncbi:unnamed protein product [Absidia cylindrospora]